MGEVLYIELWNKCGPRSNGNKGVLHIPQISRTEVSPSDAV